MAQPYRNRRKRFELRAELICGIINHEMMQLPNKSNDFPLFELVINPNTSIINSTGLSNLPKVIWPNDLKKMKIQFIQNKLNFLLDGKPINLLYLGSIPPQQFRGAQKILLSLITPWRMVNNDGISNNIINHREIFN